MSLIPYTSREGREIVLRHRDALVVRDPTSQRLEIRSLPLTECPTCHQSLRGGRSSSPERHFDIPMQHDSYVDPEYFRMLRAGLVGDYHHHEPPSSPIRRLTQPVLSSGEPSIEDQDGVEFISSTPAVQEGARIKKEAFSPNYFNQFFVEERELGRGGKGVVLLVSHQIDGCQLGQFACKRVPVGDDHAWLEKVLIEVELLAKLSHPNLVSYRHVWLEDYPVNRFGPTVACAFILQQYCNSGDLLNYIVGDVPRETTTEQLKAQMRRRSKGQADKPRDLYSSQRHLSFEEIYSLFRDITSGLAYLHSANYIHRDLKPSNCLLHRESGRLTCLISDFGEVQAENVVRKSTGTTGTISYCAPEVLKRDSTGRFGNFTTKSDVFSLGMILYFLCFGRLPYRSANTIQEELEDIDQLRAEITDWKGFQDEKRERPDLPSALYHLLKRMLSLSPSERPSAAEVLSYINHETNSNGTWSDARNPSPVRGIASRRIQSLDSPLPGTPVPEPEKHPFRTSATEEDRRASGDITPDGSDFSPQAAVQNSLQKVDVPNSPRRRPHTHAMTLSRSHDGYPRSRVSPDNAGSLPLPPSPPMSTPLLMPPPTNLLGEVQRSLFLAQHRSMHLMRQNAALVIFGFRLILFLIKMASLGRRCWPYMISPQIVAPLIGLAGLDLGIPHSIPGSLVGGGSRRQDYTGRTRWAWDWKVSSALFALHFLMLWAVSRYGSLCAGVRDDWDAWSTY